MHVRSSGSAYVVHFSYSARRSIPAFLFQYERILRILNALCMHKRVEGVNATVATVMAPAADEVAVFTYKRTVHKDNANFVEHADASI